MIQKTTIENFYLTGLSDKSYRRGERAKVIGANMVTPEGLSPRVAYHVKFDDGAQDYIPVSDVQEGLYEISFERDREIALFCDKLVGVMNVVAKAYNISVPIVSLGEFVKIMCSKGYDFSIDSINLYNDHVSFNFKLDGKENKN